jgi:hypothetical protein
MTHDHAQIQSVSFGHATLTKCKIQKKNLIFELIILNFEFPVSAKRAVGIRAASPIGEGGDLQAVQISQSAEISGILCGIYKERASTNKGFATG